MIILLIISRSSIVIMVFFFTKVKIMWNPPFPLVRLLRPTCGWIGSASRKRSLRLTPQPASGSGKKLASRRTWHGICCHGRRVATILAGQDSISAPSRHMWRHASSLLAYDGTSQPRYHLACKLTIMEYLPSQDLRCACAEAAAQHNAGVVQLFHMAEP